MEEQIISILNEHEAGMTTVEISRKHGLAGATFYNFMAKFRGMDVFDARRLKSMEEENATLKRLLAEQMLDNAVLTDLTTKTQ